MIRRTKYDVGIIGGGFAGLALACLLGKAGVPAACIDQGRELNEGLRTTAISAGSRKILEDAGIWKRIHHACPIEKIEVLEGDSPVFLNLLKEDAEGKTFGWIVLNSDLRAAMKETFRSYKTLRHIAPAAARDFEIKDDKARVILDNSGTLDAKLIIGADGRGSFVREWMDVRTREWNYRRRAIICAIEHARPHRNAAIEHFRTDGPFAMLPMPDDENGNHRSAIVLTERTSTRNSLMKLDDEAFEAALAGLVPARYGTIKLIGQRAAHPLGFIHASSYIAPRMALIADAAHGIHPVAGQGLNLGFRDVKALADLIIDAQGKGEDVGAPSLLENYQRARRFDNMTMAGATDGLARLFESRLPGAQWARRAGLKALAKLPAARRFLLKRAMGSQ